MVCKVVQMTCKPYEWCVKAIDGLKIDMDVLIKYESSIKAMDGL